MRGLIVAVVILIANDVVAHHSATVFDRKEFFQKTVAL